MAKASAFENTNAPINFTDEDVETIKHSLELALQSAKRGKNTAKQPEFKALYDRQEGQLQTLLGKLKT